MIRRKILILDDDTELRMPFFHIMLNPHEVHHAPTADICMQLLRNQTILPSYDYIFLDHDLELSGANCGDGREVIKFITSDPAVSSALHCTGTQFIVHSLNSTFSPDMVRELETAGFRVCRRAYAWHDRDHLRSLSDSDWPMDLERWGCRYPTEDACVYGLEHRAKLVSQQGTLVWE